MSRSYHKTPYKIAGKRRSQLTRVHHRLARTRFKRDPELGSGAYKKLDSDISWELHAGTLGPTWKEYKAKRRKEDPIISEKALKREYYKRYRNK